VFFASFYFLKYTHTRALKAHIIIIMLQEPMHQTKDDKPQCQATTKKGTRAFCVIFLLLLLLLLCAFHVLRSIDRARLITNPRVCFSTRFSPRRYKNRFPLLRARAFFSPPLSFSPTRCSRGCLFMYICTTGDQCQRPATEGSKYCAQHAGGSK